MPHAVRVNRANTNLPNGFWYGINANVVLSDEQYSKLASDIFTSGVCTDMGVVGMAGEAVTTQGPAVTLTSSQIAAAPTQANYNALQADVAALNAALSGPGKALV